MQAIPRQAPRPALRLTWPQVLAWRLARQFVPEPGPDPVTVVQRLCGVQAQVASAAELAVRLRLGSSARGDLDRALTTDGALVKTWLMRGTLHLVPAGELPVYQGALGALRFWEKPSWARGHGITAAQLEAVLDAVPRALAGRVLTREELAEAVVEMTGDAHLGEALGSGWGALLKPLSFLGRLRYGPPRDGRVTFAAPGVTPLPADEAGPRLARRFLDAHGPATPEMFDGWLLRGGARKAVLRGWFDALRDELVEVEVDGRPMLAPAEHADGLAATRPSTAVHLLPGFDQFVMGAPRDLTPLLPAEHRAKVSRAAGWISPVVVHRGRVAGVWEARNGALTFDLFDDVPAAALAAAAGRVTALLA